MVFTLLLILFTFDRLSLFTVFQKSAKASTKFRNLLDLISEPEDNALSAVGTYGIMYSAAVCR
jgi:hypothetical protein